jgi:hypothetical protein
MVKKYRFVTPRQVLLIEIERRCSNKECGAKNRIGLTKNEAQAYLGFECERCERWNSDELSRADIPDWWDDIKGTSEPGQGS